MLKSKIALKLAALFAVCLLVFSVIISSIFMLLFRGYTLEVHTDSLERRAIGLATTVSNFMSDADMQDAYKKEGVRAYSKLLENISLPNVWIVDRELMLLSKPYMKPDDTVCQELPDDAEAVVREVFGGKTAFSKTFSGVYKTPSLSVGTPIILHGEIVGVVLLHSSFGDPDTSLTQAFAILGVSIVVALLLTALMATLLSYLFTRPLNRMKDTAQRLADGDYTWKNNLRQHDEVGELACAMDVLADRLLEAGRKSEALDRMRRDFVANVSHEVRTPVTVLRGSLEALVDGVVSEPAQVESYHREMLHETIHLQRLVGDLLDLSRLQSADFAIDIDALDLGDVVADALRSAAYIAREKGVTISLSKSAAPRTAYSDYGRLRQMLLIILDNAVKFSPAGGTVEVTLEGRSIAIRDHGAGISPEDLPYIFERFYKSGAAENDDGTGLGLAIAKQIADRHGTVISAHNAADGGAIFEITV